MIKAEMDRQQAPQGETGTKLVLLVDDDTDFLYQQKLMFESRGWRVLTAEGEAQACEILAQAHPDLAIIDLMMENADGGFSLCYHIKKKDPAIPVIMVTSVTNETGLDFDTTTDDERSWIKADALLAKPIRFEQLEREIERVMRK